MDPVPGTEIKPSKPPVLRWRVTVTALVMTGVLGWVLYLALADPEPERDPHELSLADGRSRFYITRYPVAVNQAKAQGGLQQRITLAWLNFRRQQAKKNPAAWSFPARPVQPCGIGMFNQCMEVTGTRYLIAVEIAGVVEFGHTNALNGAQWVMAFENAVQASKSVVCYDYATKQNFEDSLLLIREKPGLVKVVPRSKLAAYQKAGLVDANFKPEN